MLRWNWNDYFGKCKVLYADGKYHYCKMYFANCYFGTCVATWETEEDKKNNTFTYEPVFWFSNYKHAKSCINDGVLSECKDFIFYYDENDDRTLDKETIQVAKLLIKNGYQVTFKSRKRKCKSK